MAPARLVDTNGGGELASHSGDEVRFNVAEHGRKSTESGRG